MTKIYNFNAKTLQGQEISLKDYEGKTVLIVNTASECGLTPQYEVLEKMYKHYQDKNFVILGFPCNQFAGQEPGDEKSISEGCVLNYGVSFPMFAKIDVNGENAHPLYKYLRSEKPNDFGDENSPLFAEKVKPARESFDDSDIVWNFGKFLINKTGEVVERFSPEYLGEELTKKIEEIL